MFWTNQQIQDFKEPFRHWIVDDFLPQQAAESLYFNFPEPDDEWYRYDNMFEMKRATDKFTKIPIEHWMVLAGMNTDAFILVLEKITGIEGIIPDPAFRGGGLHWSGKGGKLDVHADFCWHEKLKLHRKLNSLLYLNKDWKEEHGGELQLWSQQNGEAKECVVKLAPKFNRLVIFETDSNSFHGHPTPWNSSIPRRSLAHYFYTSSSSKPENAHSTMFKKLPGEVTSPEIELLRQRRNKGRL